MIEARHEIHSIIHHHLFRPPILSPLHSNNHISTAHPRTMQESKNQARIESSAECRGPPQELNEKFISPIPQALVPTPSLRSEPFLSAFSALYFFHSAAISSLLSFFSVIRFFNHLFSVSN